MRRAVALTASVVFLGFLVACGSRGKTSAPLPPAPKPVTPPTEKEVVKATKKTEGVTSPPTKKKEPSKAAPMLDYLGVHRDYVENPFAAEKKYTGKLFRDTGVVSVFMPGKSDGKRIVVLRSKQKDIEKASLANMGAAIGLICTLDESDALSLKKDQTITVEGQFGEYDRSDAGSGVVSVYLLRCRIVKD